MRLAHLSDIHLDTTGLRPWHLPGKRITGAFNLALGRRGKHRSHVVESALEALTEIGCEHTVVTGDITNLSLPAEFIAARAFLDTHVDPDTILSVVPGNHDRYTADSAARLLFEKSFEPYIRTDLPELSEGQTWPYVQLFDDVAIIGLNSAIPLPAFMAAGRVGSRQRSALRDILEHPEVEQRYSVVLIHHHFFKPENKRYEFPRGLFDRRKVLDILTTGGADLVLHGHNHWYGFRQLGETLICEAGSSSIASASDPRHGGKFNVYDIEDGVLQGFDTWLYDPDAARFQLWKRWSQGAFGPAGGEPE